MSPVFFSTAGIGVQYRALSVLISSEFMYCAELTTVKAVYSDVVTLKRRQVLGLAKVTALWIWVL